MNLADPTEHIPRILGFTDTFGADAGNGVARFLHDLHDLAADNHLPLEFVVPAREQSAPGLMQIRAPSFTVPGYGELSIATPLRHHRKTIERHIKTQRPDCIHASTPGPFGCFGVTLARRYRIPLVGIYHTDFPSYARDIVVSKLTRLKDNPQHYFGPLVAKMLPLVLPQFQKLQAANPEIGQDLETLGEILSKNYAALSGDTDAVESVASMAHVATEQILQKFYAKFDLVVARSTHQQEMLMERLRLPAEKIRCLQAGTDIDRFHPQHRDRNLWQQFGIPQDAFVALYVGRVTAEKNIDFLLETWRRVQVDGDQDLRLVVVGHGEQEDLDRAEAIRGVHVIGSRQGESLSKCYASADLLVFPSVTETLGQVGLEAGASGLPVIVSDVGGPKMYVEDGVTGFVMSTDDASAWANRIRDLAIDGGRQAKSMGQQARVHIADNYTLQHTLQSYWDLHAEAIESNKAAMRSRPERRLIRKLPPAIASQVPSEGVMVISDFHAGKRYATAAQRAQKQAAISEMLMFAVKQNLEVILAGDFGDHGSRVSRLEADFESFRRIRADVGFNGEPVFLRGNHDYGFTDERLCELTGGCRVHDSLVYLHAGSGVTVTHGHILGLTKTIEVVRSTHGADELMAQLREDLLDEDLKPAVIAYDLANLIESTLAKQGLTGVSTAWESLFQTRAILAERLLHFSRQTNDADEATWKMIAGLVGTHDNVEVAGLLGAACGGWASIFGHTHEPLAKRKRVSVADNEDKVSLLVGNSGHINRKRPTCAVAKFPELVIYQYDFRSGGLRPQHRAGLSRSDVDAFIARHSSTKVCA